MQHVGKDSLLEEFTRERHVLEGYILAIVRDPHVAEDVYQDTAVEVLKSLERYDSAQPFRGWVLGIARNKSKQALAKLARLQPTPSERLAALIETAYQEQEPDCFQQLSSAHLYLRDCMTRLTARLREMIRLRYFDNLSAKAVAERMGKSAGAVDVALSRARQALAECVAKRRTAVELDGRATL
ncbi:MAG: RNA polymerase sigma factor [Planctomycetota bacterium]